MKQKYDPLQSSMYQEPRTNAHLLQYYGSGKLCFISFKCLLLLRFNCLKDNHNNIKIKPTENKSLKKKKNI